MIRQLLAALTARRQALSGDSDRPGERLVAAATPWQEVEQEELSRWWAEMERRVLAGEPVDPDPLPHPFATDSVEVPQPGTEPHDQLEDVLDHRCEQPLDHRPPGPRRDDSPPDRPFDAVSWPPEELLDENSCSPETTPRPADYYEPSAPPDGVARTPRSPDRSPPVTTATDPAHVTSTGLSTPGRTSRPAPAAHGQPTDEAGWWAAADKAVDDAGQAVVWVGRKLAHAQHLVRTAAAADSADEAAWQAGPAGRLTDAEDAITALLSATDTQRALLADLLATTGGGGLADRPRIALTDALSGALLALTDLPGLNRAGTCGRTACRRDVAQCTHDLNSRPRLGPPGPTDAYRPATELDRWVRARDRRCRFPGCRRRVPRGGELDHHRPYPAGSTSAENLVGFCTTDHRGKHQAPGWRQHLDPDGTLTVTTPTGLVAFTSPPPY